MNRTTIALAALAASLSWAAFAQTGAPAPQAPKAETAQCERHDSGGCPMHEAEAGMKHEGHGMMRKGHGMRHAGHGMKHGGHGMQEGHGMKHEGHGSKGGDCMGESHGKHHS